MIFTAVFKRATYNPEANWLLEAQLENGDFCNVPLFQSRELLDVNEVRAAALETANRVFISTQAEWDATLFRLLQTNFKVVDTFDFGFKD